MSKPTCQIVCYALPALDSYGRPFAFPTDAPARVGARCETHGFDIGGTAHGGLCPIGQIEEATKLALARIQDASKESRKE
ncbi:hypothetical protein [Methyloceanibacter caenitepidi]|uniref:Uncharacterized protein n=1 Tax=Methyloceanibacter caenitepidi TaxID=1384459 RepID=A0A0A8K2F7_9HYPH|nr:hypothetical protein [Methyloceanibacter caenitepidi]BAQ16941.1 hypothetical protein GL4_1485 [Methyloceanibacter caenitepidi]